MISRFWRLEAIIDVLLMHYWSQRNFKEQPKKTATKQINQTCNLRGRLVLTANQMEIMTNIFIHIAFFTISSWVHLHNNAHNITDNLLPAPFEIKPQENTWIFFNFGYWTYSGISVSGVLCDSTVLSALSGPFTCLTRVPPTSLLAATILFSVFKAHFLFVSYFSLFICFVPLFFPSDTKKAKLSKPSSSP